MKGKRNFGGKAFLFVILQLKKTQNLATRGSYTHPEKHPCS